MCTHPVDDGTVDNPFERGLKSYSRLLEVPGPCPPSLLPPFSTRPQSRFIGADSRGLQRMVILKMPQSVMLNLIQHLVLLVFVLPHAMHEAMK